MALCLYGVLRAHGLVELSGMFMSEAFTVMINLQSSIP